VTPVRIIGIGSPHGADAVGWRAVEALQQGGLAARFPADTVSLENCASPVQLYRLVERCRVAVLIDAVASDARQPMGIEPSLLCRERGGCSVHGIGVADMLELLDALAESPPRVVLFGFPIGAAADQSAPLRAMLPALSRRIEEVIERYLASGG
jgi:hydrogenase maturation protease